MKSKLSKVLSLLLASVLTFSSFAQCIFSAYAQETAELVFEVENGKATLRDVNNDVAVIEIPDEYEGVPVTSIYQFAFLNLFNTEKFVVSEDNKYFTVDDYGVLYSKDKTTLIKFPAGSGVTEYTIPEGVENLGDRAFAYAKNLVSVSTPSTLSSIGQYDFYSCKKLENVEIADGPFMIGESAFEFCRSLELPDFPDSVISIRYAAFSYTKVSGVVKLPPKLSSLGIFSSEKIYVSCAFGDNVTGYSIDESNTRFSTDEKGVLYNKDKTILYAYPQAAEDKEFTVPQTVKRLHMYAFTGARYLETLILPASITQIDDEVISVNDKTSVPHVCYEGSQADWDAIEIGSQNSTFLSRSFSFNYGALTGSCGDNLTWSFDKAGKTLTVSGDGEMYDFDSFDEYGWCSFKDEIEIVAFQGGVKSVGTNAFRGCSQLKEVYLGNTVEKLGANAFAECENLAIVSSRSLGLTADETAFTGTDERLTVLYNSKNTQLEEWTSANSINSVAVNIDQDKKVIEYCGELTVYEGLPYDFLSRYAKLYPTMEYLYFEKLVFDGVEPEFISVEELENDTEAEYLTFNNLYVSLKVIDGGKTKDITFADFITLFEKGEYDAFMFELKSDEGTQKLTFEEILEKATEHFVANALRLTAKIVNFFRRIFK